MGKREREIQDHLMHKNFDRADLLLEELGRAQPSNPDLFFLMGVSYYLQGKFRASEKSLLTCLDLDPKHTDAAICLAVLQNDVGNYEDGRRSFERANASLGSSGTQSSTQVDRAFAVKHLELGDMYFRYRRYNEASEEYIKASALDPLNLAIRINKARALAKKGFVTRAMQELQSLKHENPAFVPARIQLGLLHFSQENILDAELEWEHVLSLEPDNKEVKNYLALAKGARQNPGRTLTKVL